MNAGHEIILQVENNPHCIQVLKANFPATAIVFDIVTLQTLPLDTDIVVAGFPCQDVSTENQYRPGIEKGLRSGLVSHVFRLLKNKKVPWVIFENVPGLLNWHWNQDPPQQPGIAYITRELEQLGYRWAYRIVDLASFGIPHSRARVFIVASIHGDPRDIYSYHRIPGVKGNVQKYSKMNQLNVTSALPSDLLYLVQIQRLA